MTCALCRRNVEKLTEHHLIPRARLKKGERSPTLWLCWDCHRQVHALFTHQELAEIYNTKERLRDEPRIAEFLKWISRQDPNKAVRVKR